MSNVPPANAPSAPSGGEVVLVVDDEEDIRRLVTFNLSDAGFKVESVENGAEALAAATRLRPSVVVLDLMLPDVSGMEVCRRLRANDSVADAAIQLLVPIAPAELLGKPLVGPWSPSGMRLLFALATSRFRSAVA